MADPSPDPSEGILPDCSALPDATKQRVQLAALRVANTFLHAQTLGAPKIALSKKLAALYLPELPDLAHCVDAQASLISVLAGPDPRLDDVLVASFDSEVERIRDAGLASPKARKLGAPNQMVVRIGLRAQPEPEAEVFRMVVEDDTPPGWDEIVAIIDPDEPYSTLKIKGLAGSIRGREIETIARLDDSE